MPGPIGLPRLAVVHGGESITPAGGSDGFDYARLERLIASRPVIVQLDRQTIARIVTTEQSYSRSIG